MPDIPHPQPDIEPSTVVLHNDPMQHGNPNTGNVDPPYQRVEDAPMASPPAPVRLQSAQTRPSLQSKGRSNSQSLSAQGEIATNSQSGSEAVAPSTSVSQQETAPTMDAEVKDGATTPRGATLGLGDAMWNQAQRHARFALNETYRIRHGCNPPGFMRIMETSALERSRVSDTKLRAALEAEKRATIEAASKANGDVQREEGNIEHSVGQRSSRSSITSNASATLVPVQSSFMSDANFFDEEIGDEWVPAKSGATIIAERNAASVASISPTTPELRTPLDNPTQPSQAQQSPHPDATEVRSVALQQKVLPLLRHDGHLASHVSGLGGTYCEAYDGRSYLPDDAEPDPDHLPPAPPGARSGDNRLILPLRPHPLHVRGQKVHRLMEPPSTAAISIVNELNELKKSAEEDLNEGADSETDEPTDEAEAQKREKDSAIQKLEKEAAGLMLKQDEQGDGWGFVESGSHGEYDNGLLSEAEKRKKASAPARLKLSTEKKTAPKMACHFCRQRKIACGPGDVEGTCK